MEADAGTAENLAPRASNRDRPKKSQEIHARARAENRPMTDEEQSQCVAYGRASLTWLVDSVTCETLIELGRQIKTGTLSRTHVRIAKVLALRGHRQAQEILDVHYQRKNNLPVEDDWQS
jgi:hypothetical protein